MFLNASYGAIREKLKEFINSYLPTTNVFCFQEAGGDFNNYYSQLLNNYELIEDYKKVDEDDIFPQATYISKEIKLHSKKTLYKKNIKMGLVLYTEIDFVGITYHLCNVHGISKPGNKLDTPGRLEQSKGIIEFLSNKNGLKIIGGDFNLGLETKSVKMFEEAGYRNLIREFNIKTTRNRLIWEKYPETPQYYADFVFISSDVNVKDFFVIKNEVSDHLPLILHTV